jgi:hypothetical protein
MKEQIVSFKTAKAAKEKGFMWKTVDHYRDMDCTHNGVGYNFNNPEEQELWSIEITSAPTQSLLQKWLRDVHNCYIVITPEPLTVGINFNFQVLFYNPNAMECWDDKSSGMYGDNGEYPTYEESLEAGLQEALNRI